MRRFRRRAAVLASVLGLYASGVGVLYAAQDRLLFDPDRTPLAIASAAAVLPGLRTVTLSTEDGLSLAAWYRPADGGSPTVIYLHGNGGNLVDRIGRMRFLAARGYGLLCVEYRGYGGNPGRPSEAGFAADGRAAADWLAAHGVAPAQTVLYGESLGTAVAVRLATERPVAAVVLDSPFTSIADLAASIYWYVPVRWLIRNPFELRSLLDRVQAPLLITNGSDDVIVPPAMGAADFATAHEPKALWTAPGASHTTVLESGGDGAMAGFLQATMGHR